MDVDFTQLRDSITVAWAILDDSEGSGIAAVEVAVCEAGKYPSLTTG